MKMYKSYILAILKKSKKTFKEYLSVQAVLVILAFISSLIAMYLINYQGKFKVSLIIGLLEFVPIIGNGLYLSYLIIFNLIKQETVIASNLAVLYLTILTVRLVLEPILLSRKINFRVAIVILLAIISAIIKGNKGVSVISIIIFILNSLININDIYSFNRKKILRERKEKRKKQREQRQKYEYENLGESYDSK
ncbi:hypothetical protein HMPREF3188_00171 [Tissierellia bacterium KA00581]|nr:hypothetical protein HMPREF3188_00171 [Tissierellia bacterium KA00581]